MSPLSSEAVLPAELVDTILDLLHDDWRALSSCALVHPEWAPRAFLHLGRGVTLYVEPPDHPDLADFSRMFHTGSPLCDSIRDLTIQGRAVHQTGTPLPLLPPIPERFSLPRLPHIRSLTLRSFSLDRVQRNNLLLANCDSIEHLSIEGVEFDPTVYYGEAMEDVSTEALLDPFSAPPLQFTCLKTLRAHHSSLAAWQSLIGAEGEGIRDVNTTLPSLQGLSLHHLMPGVGHNLATPARQDHLWHETIYSVLHSLVDLSITVTTPLPRYFEGISSVMIASRSLQRLTIRLWNAQLRLCHWHDNIFLRVLSILFRNIATHNHAAVNATLDPPLLQNLETFTILMPYRSFHNGIDNFDRPARLFNGIGQNLASADACPALSAVRVGAVCYTPEHSGEMVSGYFDAIRAPLEARGVAVEVKLGLGEDEWEAWAAAR